MTGRDRPGRATRRPPSPCEGGFTLVEIIVMLTVAAVLAAFAYVTLRGVLVRSRLLGTAQQIAVLSQRARYESIKLAAPAVVEFGLDGTTIAFVDRNVASGGSGSDLTYNPERASTPEVCDRLLDRLNLPEGVAFAGAKVAPEAKSTFEGLTPRSTPGASPVVVLRPDGTIASRGAVRLSDVFGNVLEVRYFGPNLRIELRKWVDRDRLWRSREEGSWEWSTQTPLP